MIKSGQTLVNPVTGERMTVDGLTDARGMPNPFRLAVVAQAHFDTVRLPFSPVALQRAALAVGAPLGRALRYGPTHRRELPLQPVTATP
jgi:hypothetical protein